MNKDIDIEAWADELSNSKLDLIELLHSYVDLLEEKKKIDSHAPEGRNYTNAQYAKLFQENRKLTQMIEEGIGFEELQNPDDQIPPHQK